MIPKERRTIDHAIARLRDAWSNAGPVPDYHHRAKAELYGTWPTLANAITDLLAAANYPEGDHDDL